MRPIVVLLGLLVSGCTSPAAEPADDAWLEHLEIVTPPPQAPQAAGLPIPLMKTFTGHVDVPFYCAPGVGGNEDVEPLVYEAATEDFDLEVPVDTRFLNGTLEWPASPTTESNDLDLHIFDGNGTYRDGAYYGHLGETFSVELPPGDEGTWRIHVLHCLGAPTDFTLTVELS